MSSGQPADFFISHTKADREWAVWIAQTLEANGYRTLLQEWDFRPGNNFVLMMHEAARAGTRVIAVVSPDYLQSPFGAPEWAAAFADDPQGTSRSLIPVIVRPVERSGLLNQVVPINLVDAADEATAVAELLDGVGSDSRRPTDRVSYPGGRERDTMQSVGTHTDGWEPIDPSAVDVALRDSSRVSGWDPNATLEVYLIPQPSRRLQAARLRDLPDALAAVGRRVKFFTSAQPLSIEVQTDMATAETQPNRDTPMRGLSLRRDGSACAWDALPGDSMGAVIDLHDVESRLELLLRLLLEVPELDARSYVPAARIVTRGLYIFGDASRVGTRSGAGGLKTGGDVFSSDPEDRVSLGFLTDHTSEVAHELAARLESKWRDAASRSF